MKTFKEDYRTSNANLHLLYTKWAVKHLVTIDKCIADLDALSNLNLLDCISALHKERKKLVTQNAAYADAEEILQSICIE